MCLSVYVWPLEANFGSREIKLYSICVQLIRDYNLILACHGLNSIILFIVFDIFKHISIYGTKYSCIVLIYTHVMSTTRNTLMLC
jgi:hypothetical protein